MTALQSTMAQTAPMGAEPGRARAVFAPADFAMLKEAVGDYIGRLDPDDRRLNHLAALYHRLGRIS